MTSFISIKPFICYDKIMLTDKTSIDQAFLDVKQSNFLPDSEKSLTDLDMPLPIGHGQTNSQATTARMMLE